MDDTETWVGLFQGGNLWMSNTPDEYRWNRCGMPCQSHDGGVGLTAGLGLGLVIEILQGYTKQPTKLTVVELNPDIISLVSPTYSKLPWLEIIQCDIKEFGKTGPNGEYDWAYIDIWGNMSQDDLPEMTAIKRSLRRVMKPGPKRISCWNEEPLRRGQRW
jgi:hypothetical protein